jgi:LysM repeat protein
MKIMKVLGVVVGIHVFALILIFANPGCSSTSKPTPAPVDTIAKSEPAPAITVPGVQPGVDSGAPPVSAAPIMFNPDAPALSGGGGIRFTPTRPGTAAASTLVAEPVANVTPASTYTVTSGESLWSISHKKNLSVTELAAANNLGSNAMLHAGQKLLIPGKSAAAAAPAAGATSKPVIAPKAPADSVKHTVKAGETLSSIAKNYGVRQGDIAVANNIQDPQKIRAGMELVIPGWKSTSDKNAKAPAAGPAAKTVSPGDGKAAAPAAPAASGSQIPVIGPGTTPTAVPVIHVEEAPAKPTKP